jgi:hypothetical protein
LMLYSVRSNQFFSVSSPVRGGNGLYLSSIFNF